MSTTQTRAAPGPRVDRHVPVAERRRWVALGLAIAVVAFVVRLSFVRTSGLDGYTGYDDGVYYTASADLLFGATPYRHVLLLQAPGSMLFLAPFVWLGAHTSDAVGVATGRLAFMAMGGLIAFLIVRYAARWGRAAAATAGLTYAVSFAAAFGDRTFLLEPIGSLAMVLALVLLPRRGGGRPWQAYLAGCALGFAASTKIWYALPLLVFVLFQTRRDAIRVVLGAVGTGALVCGPFLAMAPARFVREVVIDQLTRPPTSGGIAAHLTLLMSMLAGHLTVTPTWTVALAAVVACTLLAASLPGARCVTALFVANAALLILGSLFFTHYTTFVTPLLAIVAGAAVARVGTWRHGLGTATATGLVAAVALSSAGSLARVGAVYHPVPTSALRAAVDSTGGCVTAQMPILIADADRLTSDLRAGCLIYPDTTGWIYDSVVMNRPAAAPFVGRTRSPRWQALEARYLESGSTTIIRGSGHSLDRRTLADVDDGVIARAREYTVYRTADRGPMPDPG